MLGQTASDVSTMLDSWDGARWCRSATVESHADCSDRDCVLFSLYSLMLRLSPQLQDSCPCSVKLTGQS